MVGEHPSTRPRSAHQLAGRRFAPASRPGHTPAASPHHRNVAKPSHRAFHDTLKVERDCENRRPAETSIKIIKTGVCQKGPDTTRRPRLQVIDNTRLRTPPASAGHCPSR